MKALPLTCLIFIIGVFTFTSCQETHQQTIKPAEKSGWELVKEVEGHHRKITDAFQLNGNQVVIVYDAKSEGHYTHSSLDVQLGTGAEDQWSNPQIEVLNQEHAKGEKVLNAKAGRYLLKIDALNAHYHLKVYQKASGK